MGGVDKTSMKIFVNASPQKVPFSGAVVIQNLGPSNLWMDTNPSVTAATGMKLPVNACYEFPREINLGPGAIWLIADTTADVRIIEVYS